MPRRPNSPALLARKRRFVRSEIWNAAIDLFSKNGYGPTTVDEIAAAAGVSRRTFFRYFSSKDDVMVQASDTYGDILSAAIRESAGVPLPLLDIVKRAVLRVAEFVVVQPRARLAMQIVEDSAAARGAQLSEFAVIERRVASEFASAVGSGSADGYTPDLLASLTFLTLKLVFKTWRHEEPDRISDTVEDIFASVVAITSQAQRGKSETRRINTSRAPRRRARSSAGASSVSAGARPTSSRRQ